MRACAAGNRGNLSHMTKTRFVPLMIRMSLQISSPTMKILHRSLHVTHYPTLLQMNFASVSIQAIEGPGASCNVLTTADSGKLGSRGLKTAQMQQSCVSIQSTTTKSYYSVWLLMFTSLTIRRFLLNFSSFLGHILHCWGQKLPKRSTY